MTVKGSTALGKRARISQAQQYMLLSVMGASVFLGATLALTVNFAQRISFNKRVIMAEEQSMKAYSDAIRTTGVCQKPKGDTYSNDELAKCNPSSISLSQIQGTLRANVLEQIASNDNLNAVPKDADSTNCKNQNTNKNYTLEELNKIYNDASASGNDNEVASATQLMKTCSALRVIPDALPAFRNEEALLASLNKLFLDAGWQPESLSPGGASSSVTDLKPGLNALTVNVSVEADPGTTMNVLYNIESSIREFNMERATIEWSGDSSLNLQAVSTAYYMDESSIPETQKTIKPQEGKKK